MHYVTRSLWISEQRSYPYRLASHLACLRLDYRFRCFRVCVLTLLRQACSADFLVQRHGSVELVPAWFTKHMVLVRRTSWVMFAHLHDRSRTLAMERFRGGLA
jgi:hypothetical protein